MGVEVSITQRKRTDKIERLRRYFSERREIHEWNPAVDEAIDWKSITDEEVAKYLKSVS